VTLVTGVYLGDLVLLTQLRQCQCQSKFFSVAKIAELLQCPQMHSRVTIQNWVMIVEKEMFLGVDRK